MSLDCEHSLRRGCMLCTCVLCTFVDRKCHLCISVPAMLLCFDPAIANSVVCVSIIFFALEMKEKRKGKFQVSTVSCGGTQTPIKDLGHLGGISRLWSQIILK